MSEALSLTVEDLVVRVQKKTLLKSLSFELKAGGCLGIIGPNGSGKTTLLQTILGFIPPDQGRVLLANKDLHTLPARERARSMAYVAQDSSAAALPFTVESFLQLAFFPWRESLSSLTWEQDQKRLCAEFKLLDKLPRHLSTLSGGERQRVILVQSLLQRPKLLLLDELTNHLDIFYQLETLQYLSRQPMTRLMVLHDVNHAARFCDQLLMLKEGACIAAGPTADILTEKAIEDLFEVPCEIMRSSGGIRHVALGVRA